MPTGNWRETAKGKHIKSLLEKFPDTPSRTLARKLFQEHPELFATLNAARGAVRYYRGNKGGTHRERATDKSHFRENGKAGEVIPEMPPSIAEPWEPYFLPAKIKKLLVLSDIHIPYHSELALRTAVDYGIEAGCDGVLLNGDWADFFSISRYDKNPSKVKFRKEMRAIKQMFDWLRAKFPKAPIIAKAGNHEERWDHYLWNHAAVLSDHPHMLLRRWLGFKKRGIEWVGDQRPIIFCGEYVNGEVVGGLPILHGHELAKGLATPVNQARGMFLRTIHTLLCGHGHRTSQHTEPDLWHHEITCWSTGCLCDLRPEYARTNKWNWGFAVLHRKQGNAYHVDNLRISKKGTVR